MLAVILVAALFQSAPTPKDLSYGEVYGCNRLAKAGHDMMYEGGTSPVTTSEIAMAEALQRLVDLTTAELEPARIRDGWTADNIAGAHRAADEALANATGDQLGEVLKTCAAIFGVVAP